MAPVSSLRPEDYPPMLFQVKGKYAVALNMPLEKRTSPLRGCMLYSNGV
jgi:hypothetical protein